MITTGLKENKRACSLHENTGSRVESDRQRKRERTHSPSFYNKNVLTDSVIEVKKLYDLVNSLHLNSLVNQKGRNS